MFLNVLPHIACMITVVVFVCSFATDDNDDGVRDDQDDDQNYDDDDKRRDF